MSVMVISIAFISSCKKASYITDDGVHSLKTPFTTYDYLKQHPAHLFDTLVLVLDKFNLKDEVNNAGTFFAPTDYSIRKFIDFKKTKGDYTLDSLYKNLTADTIRQYLFEKKINRASLDNEAPMIFSNKGKTVTAVRKIKSPDFDLWSGAPVYFLYYIKVVDELDQGSPAGAQDIQIRCQTADIETASGGILNVLDNNHVFANF